MLAVRNIVRSWTFRCLAAAWLGGAGLAQCLELQKGFRLPGPTDRVSVLESIDLGDGPKLYAGGLFTQVDDDPAAHVAAWDGTAWRALGRGVNGEVLAIQRSADPSKPRIFVGGAFDHAGGAPASRIAAWDGTRWDPLGSGVDGTVRALAEFDDGSGPALYAGGEFENADGSPALHVARWNGVAWSKVGSGLEGSVRALTVFDDGTGPALYAGGSSQGYAGIVSRWNGSAWSIVGREQNCTIESLCPFRIGGTPVLCAGGCGVSAWNGQEWWRLGGDGPSGLCLRALDDGSGLALYAGDFFQCSRWNGLAWSTLPTMCYGPTFAFAVHDDGHGPALYAGGEVYYSPYALPQYLGRFDGSVWVPVGRGLGTNLGVDAMALFDDGSGESLYAAGRFTTAGSTRADRIARLDGDRWSALEGGGIGDSTAWSEVVQALCAYDDGSGASLYAGGSFSAAGGIPAQNVARWNGSGWSALGSGIEGSSTSGVDALATFDDGTGAKLYVGGNFDTAGGTSTQNLAAWDGKTWSDVGGGTDGKVTSMAVFDDGTGPALFVAGEFANAGGLPSAGVARWNGTTWSSAALYGYILSLKVFDDGRGSALYAGGEGPTLLQRWNGSGWDPIRSLEWDGAATAMEAFDDGSGSELFAAAGLMMKGYPPIYRWDGRQVDYVTSFPGGLDNASAMLAWNGDLWVSSFSPSMYGAMPISGIAKYRGCSPPGVPFCGGASAPVSCPCDNLGSPGRGCANSSVSAGAGLTSTGTASLGSDTLHLVTDGELASSLSIVWQGDADVAPHRFGDGVTCVAGRTRRLFELQASAGSVSVPRPSDPPISQRASALGDVIAPGDRRIYQVFYRDPVADFCPPPVGSSFNTTNALSVYWRP